MAALLAGAALGAAISVLALAKPDGAAARGPALPTAERWRLAARIHGEIPRRAEALLGMTSWRRASSG